MMLVAAGLRLMSALFLWGLCTHIRPAGAFFGWMTKKAAPSPAPPPPFVPEAEGGAPPPFEMSVADERFLAEAKQLELSPLDTCHYRVIAKIKTTCSSLSEEELAKLGVVLFNCQAEVEGRRTFPCTEEMTIKECTAEMDSDTWNAYHIVSNRARSVCYATRQQHFRRKAELTVNSLISSAANQLETMKTLKEGQLELKELTASSVEKLLLSHGALLDQQGALQNGQQQLDSAINSNLERLTREKELISSGQELVAQLIQRITQRMENVSEHLKGQGLELQDGHRAILADLAEVRGQAKDIYKKIEQNLSGFLLYQNRTAHFYDDLMGKLQRMNSTLGLLVHYLDVMQGRLEDRLRSIQGYLGWAGFSRAALLVMVLFNAVAEINQQPALDFTGLSLLLLLVSVGHWFLLQLFQGCVKLHRRRNASPPMLCPGNTASETEILKFGCLTSSTPDRGPGEAGVKLEQDSYIFDEPSLAGVSRPPQATPSHSTPLFKSRHSLPGVALEGIRQRNLVTLLDAVSDSRSSSPNVSTASIGSMSGRQLCNGITKMGQACKKRAVLGQDYCRLHEGGHTSYNPPL